MKNSPLSVSTGQRSQGFTPYPRSACKSFAHLLFIALSLCLSGVTASGDLNALAATDITDTSFTANWELADDAISHRLDVATDESFELFIVGYEDLNVGNATTWLVDGLASGVTYYYRIRALFSEGEPTQSNVVVAETPLVPGEQKWRFETDETTLGAIALTEGGAIIFAGGNGFLYSVDSESGTQNWRKDLRLSSKVRPSISVDGIIYVSGYAINAETGDVILENGLSGNTISIGPSNILILNTSDSMVAIDSESGNPLWALNQAFELAGPVISEQLVVYFAGRHRDADNVTTNNIYAVDYLTGKKLWEYDLGVRYY
ncbi:PQQ-binding-like beta-propeller repeat protein [bacterium]|nr:PQQ-binding-like beta-propeller repeat protein [Opitutales bacterium]MDB2499793.1 PQQ-binding-like beta-propeller repeat protein [bacterium]